MKFLSVNPVEKSVWVRVALKNNRQRPFYSPNLMHARLAQGRLPVLMPEKVSRVLASLPADVGK